MLHVSAGTDFMIGIWIFVIGACMGSFLNCMSWRIVHGESVLRGRSHCDVCGHVLMPLDLIPIVSYLLHRGRCRWCRAKLSSRHVWAELVTGLVYVLLVFRYDISLQALEYLLFASVLLAAAFADLEGYIIPDRFIAAGIVLRIPFLFLTGDWMKEGADALLGGFAVGGGLLAIVLIYEKIRRIEAMGGGDLKLLFVTGLYLGWAKNLLCLLLACMIGILFAVATGRGKKDGKEEIFPWGPSICMAAILAALIGDGLIDAYLRLF